MFRIAKYTDCMMYTSHSGAKRGNGLTAQTLVPTLASVNTSSEFSHLAQAANRFWYSSF